MGVKDLWNILSPVSQKTSLYELHGKTIAIDLSCWVCEGESIGDKIMSTQPRMYLRNVFFRTQTLLLLNITPVFILEGDAPQLKHDVMRHRNNARFGHRQADVHDGDEIRKPRKQGGRSRFRGILKQCQDMLEMMGVTCLQSDGEAEALCAQLNREGIVDGVISQDSDVFLYGAQTVYRNLAIKSGTGIVDAYTMSAIENKLNLNREKLIAMSLLCGCDYDPSGVHGVGKELAFKYLSSFEGDALLRLKSLRTDMTLMRYTEEKENCTKCIHIGKAGDHRKQGCIPCDMTKGCKENTSSLLYKNQSEEKRKIINVELVLRYKALSDESFPCQKTIDEFLCFNQTVPYVDYAWKLPDITRFASFCGRMLEWELDYGFEKLLPLLTRWESLQAESFEDMPLRPREISKKRVVKGVPSLEIFWEINDENISSFLCLLTDDCSVKKDDGCTSTEPLIMISQRMPDLYAAFMEKTNKKKIKTKVPKRNKKLEDSVNDIVHSLASVSISSQSNVLENNSSNTCEVQRSTSVSHSDNQCLKDCEEYTVAMNVSHLSNDGTQAQDKISKLITLQHKNASPEKCSTVPGVFSTPISQIDRIQSSLGETSMAVSHINDSYHRLGDHHDEIPSHEDQYFDLNMTDPFAKNDSIVETPKRSPAKFYSKNNEIFISSPVASPHYPSFTCYDQSFVQDYSVNHRDVVSGINASQLESMQISKISNFKSSASCLHLSSQAESMLPFNECYISVNSIDKPEDSNFDNLTPFSTLSSTEDSSTSRERTSEQSATVSSPRTSANYFSFQRDESCSVNSDEPQFVSNSSCIQDDVSNLVSRSRDVQNDAQNASLSPPPDVPHINQLDLSSSNEHDSTLEYDISQILDDIVARKTFY